MFTSISSLLTLTTSYTVSLSSETKFIPQLVILTFPVDIITFPQILLLIIRPSNKSSIEICNSFDRSFRIPILGISRLVSHLEIVFQKLLTFYLILHVSSKVLLTFSLSLQLLTTKKDLDSTSKSFY